MVAAYIKSKKVNICELVQSNETERKGHFGVSLRLSVVRIGTKSNRPAEFAVIAWRGSRAQCASHCIGASLNA